ncbi:hypothetical protein MHK_001585, partial [Candidatus Magnetomorum sp. HK-1]
RGDLAVRFSSGFPYDAYGVKSKVIWKDSGGNLEDLNIEGEYEYSLFDNLSVNRKWYFQVWDNGYDDTGYIDYVYVKVYYSTPDPIPTISSVSPDSMTEGSTSQWIYIYGSNFSNSISGYPTVWIDGIKLSGGDSTGAAPATYVSSTQIKVKATLVYWNSDTTRDLAVRYNSGSNDKVYKSNMITVKPKVPTISSVSPTSMTEGSTSQWIYIYGSNFSNSISGYPTVWIDGIKLSGGDSTGAAPATYVSSTQIKVKATLVYWNSDTTRDLAVRYNSGSNDKVYKSNMITVNPKVPTISSVSPTPMTEGSTSQWIYINGSNFSNSISGYPTVWIDGIKLSGGDSTGAAPATYVSSTQIKVQAVEIYGGIDQIRDMAIRYNSGENDKVEKS